MEQRSKERWRDAESMGTADALCLWTSRKEKEEKEEEEEGSFWAGWKLERSGGLIFREPERESQILTFDHFRRSSPIAHSLSLELDHYGARLPAPLSKGQDRSSAGQRW